VTLSKVDLHDRPAAQPQDELVAGLTKLCDVAVNERRYFSLTAREGSQVAGRPASFGGTLPR